MVTKAAVGGLLALVWLGLVGPGTFALTLVFLGAGLLWGRASGRRDAVRAIDQVNRWCALQTELRHIERNADHEAQHLSEWYRHERERIVSGW